MIGQIVFPAHLPVTDCGVPLLSRRLRTVLFILPVVLVGMLSIGDLVKETLVEQEGLILHLEQYIRGEVA